MPQLLVVPNSGSSSSEWWRWWCRCCHCRRIDRAAMHIKMHLAFHTLVILNLFGTDPSFYVFLPRFFVHAFWFRFVLSFFFAYFGLLLRLFSAWGFLKTTIYASFVCMLGDSDTFCEVPGDDTARFAAMGGWLVDCRLVNVEWGIVLVVVGRKVDVQQPLRKPHVNMEVGIEESGQTLKGGHP